MLFFITMLRAIAACLITNSHYTGIYPTDIIANGGLLGDVIFFAVSGYCLFNVKKTFPVWYGKRLLRIYPPVLIITAIYLILGFYTFNQHDGLWWFIYPTNYHFVASILLLYVPFYFVGKIKALNDRIPLIMAIVGIIYLLVYVVFYDKTYYHIDNVREWMIRFLFFESMLLGAYFKKNSEKFENNFKWYLPVLVVFFFVLYFVSKLFFSKYPEFSYLQIINQVLIFVLLFFIFWLFASLENKLQKLPDFVKKIFEFLSEITLEIYVVQYVIIDVIRPHLSFPLNWIAITTAIIVSAFVLHLICKYLIKGIEFLITNIKEKNQKEIEKE